MTEAQHVRVLIIAEKAVANTARSAMMQAFPNRCLMTTESSIDEARRTLDDYDENFDLVIVDLDDMSTGQVEDTLMQICSRRPNVKIIALGEFQFARATRAIASDALTFIHVEGRRLPNQKPIPKWWTLIVRAASAVATGLLTIIHRGDNRLPNWGSLLREWALIAYALSKEESAK